MGYGIGGRQKDLVIAEKFNALLSQQP